MQMLNIVTLSHEEFAFSDLEGVQPDVIPVEEKFSTKEMSPKEKSIEKEVYENEFTQ